MSSIIYNKAFEVELSHNFYETGNQFKVNKDFEIAPTSECEELMRSGRMRFIRTPKGLVIYYQAYLDGTNAQQPLVKVQDGAEFVFAVRLMADVIPQFTTITDLDVAPKTYSAEKLFMLEKTTDNTANPLTVPLEKKLANMVRPFLFTYDFKPNPASIANADVIINNGVADVLTITNVPYNPITKSYSVEIDLSGQAKGFYTLIAKETGTSTQIHSTDFYLDGNLSSRNVFGIIRIKYDEADRLYDTTTVNGAKKFRTFTNIFGARTTTWRYYVVPKTIDTSLFDLAVIDGDAVYTFNPVNPAIPPYGNPSSLILINGIAPVILESSIKIPFKEKALTKLDVWKRDGINPDSKVIAAISNANSNGVDSDQLGAVQLPPTITAGISEIFVIV